LRASSLAQLSIAQPSGKGGARGQDVMALVLVRSGGGGSGSGRETGLGRPKERNELYT
jgi:hypothetical protein